MLIQFIPQKLIIRTPQSVCLAKLFPYAPKRQSCPPDSPPQADIFFL
jgi:hypothetical protein